MKSFNHGFCKFSEITEAIAIILCNEAEADISHIVIYGSTTWETTNHLYAKLVYTILIDFFDGILVFPDDNRIFVNIK